jgi:hypothetical protein
MHCKYSKRLVEQYFPSIAKNKTDWEMQRFYENPMRISRRRRQTGLPERFSAGRRCGHKERKTFGRLGFGFSFPACPCFDPANSPTEFPVFGLRLRPNTQRRDDDRWIPGYPAPCGVRPVAGRSRQR